MNDRELKEMAAKIVALSDHEWRELGRMVWRAKSRAAQKKLEATGYYEETNVKTRAYEAATQLITVYGYEQALADARKPWSNWLFGGKEKDIRKQMAEEKELLIAINEGMTLAEHLEFPSPYTWMKRQQRLKRQQANSGEA